MYVCMVCVCQDNGSSLCLVLHVSSVIFHQRAEEQNILVRAVFVFWSEFTKLWSVIVFKYRSIDFIVSFLRIIKLIIIIGFQMMICNWDPNIEAEMHDN